MEIISKDLIICISKLLNQRDLLHLSAVNKKYNTIIRNYFKEYFIVYNKAYELILLIEKKDPLYNKIIINCDNHKFISHRFISYLLYGTIWFTAFDCKLNIKPKKLCTNTDQMHLINNCCHKKNVNIDFYSAKNAILDNLKILLDFAGRGNMTFRYDGLILHKNKNYVDFISDKINKNANKKFKIYENSGDYGSLLGIIMTPITIDNTVSKKIVFKGYLNMILNNYQIRKSIFDKFTKCEDYLIFQNTYRLGKKILRVPTW